MVASSHIKFGARLMTFLRKYSEFSTDGELRTLFCTQKIRLTLRGRRWRLHKSRSIKREMRYKETRTQSRERLDWAGDGELPFHLTFLKEGKEKLGRKII